MRKSKLIEEHNKKVEDYKKLQELLTDLEWRFSEPYPSFMSITPEIMLKRLKEAQTLLHGIAYKAGLIEDQ